MITDVARELGQRRSLLKRARVTLIAAAALGLVCVGGACAPVPKPLLLDEVDRVSQAEAAQAAKSAAMPTWALAEKRRLLAHELAESGPLAHAEFQAEEAIATYEEGASLAAVAAGTLREAEERVLVEQLDAQLAETEGSITRVLGEIDALEARLRIAQAQGLGEKTGLVKVSADERAVLGDLLWQAKITCTAAGLLIAAGGKSTDTSLDAEAASLTAMLAGKDQELEASRFYAHRASCLRKLESARSRTASGAADALMTELSAMLARLNGGVVASRDERGVVVSLQNLFDGGKLSSEGAERLASLVRVAKAHAEFPLALVVYTGKQGKASDSKLWGDRRSAVESAFADLKSGTHVTLLAESASKAPLSGERTAQPIVEILFVSPEAL
jgi:exonuclease VII small subunit